MEYVEGRPLTTYCRERGLGIEDQLAGDAVLLGAAGVEVVELEVEATVEAGGADVPLEEDQRRLADRAEDGRDAVGHRSPSGGPHAAHAGQHGSPIRTGART